MRVGDGSVYFIYGESAAVCCGQFENLTLKLCQTVELSRNFLKKSLQ